MHKRKAAQTPITTDRIHRAFVEKSFEDIKLLLQLGFKISLADVNGDTLAAFGHETKVHVAALTGNVDQLGILLKRYPEKLDQPNDQGFTPLFWAVINRQHKMVQHLLTLGADPNVANFRNELPLHWAARQGDLAIVELLEQAGGFAKIDPQSNYGFTPLHWASSSGHSHVVQWLLERGADCRKVSHDGSTALHWATCSIKETPERQAHKNQVVNVLLAHLKQKQYLSREINRQNLIGLSAIDWAAISENHAAVSTLIEAGAEAVKWQNSIRDKR